MAGQIESLIFQFTSPQYTAFNIDKNKSTRCYLCVRQSNFVLHIQRKPSSAAAHVILSICIGTNQYQKQYIPNALSKHARQYAQTQRHGYDRTYHTHMLSVYGMPNLLPISYIEHGIHAMYPDKSMNGTIYIAGVIISIINSLKNIFSTFDRLPSTCSSHM